MPYPARRSFHGLAAAPARALSVVLAAVLAAVVSVACAGCRDVASYGSNGDHYEGAIVDGTFVRAGLESGTRLCVTLDGDRLQDAPGTITSSDGRFRATPLRPIPQLWHDPLSMLSFGEGRVQSFVYMAAPETDAGDPTETADVTVVVSLMKTGALEVRLVRSAPTSSQSPARGATAAAPAPLFGVFPLARKEGLCSF